jgi:ElaA protein
MQVALNHCFESNINSIRISAQAHLENFYAQLGFESTGKAYLEDGIPHIEMLLLKTN